MKQPEDRGEPIDADRMRSWVEEYGSYRVTVTEPRIERWLEQFSTDDRDVAARLLDSVHFIPTSQINAAFVDLLSELDGWSENENERVGKWYFCPFSGTAGKSGDLMISQFRRANNLAGRKFDQVFVHPSELVRRTPGPEDTVVFVDDFSGTGDQAIGWWEHPFKELLPLHPRVILILVAASEHALTRIEEETRMSPKSNILLTDRDRICSGDCIYFDDDDVEVIKRYGIRADPKDPLGRGDGCYVVVFGHTCPNNSVSVLHSRRRGQWEGLFRRYD